MSDFSLQRLINETQAGEGSNLPPRQYGDIRVPIVSNLKIVKVDNFFGGSTFTLTWTDPEFANIRIAQYNIFVAGIDGIQQPQGPYGATKSPAVIRVSTRTVSRLVFTVQTQLANGLTSALEISPSVASETIAPIISDTDLPASGVTQGTYGSATQASQITVASTGLITSAANVTITGVTPGGAAGGGLSGTYPNPEVTLTSAKKGVLLGSLVNADFNVTADQSITIAAAKYIIRKIVVTDASLSLTTAAGGIYPAAAKAGTPLVAAAQTYAALTAAIKYLDLTLEAIVGTDTYALATLYFSLTTPQGAAATGDIYVYGDIL